MLVSQEDATMLLSANPCTLLPLMIVWKQGTVSLTYVGTLMLYVDTYQEKGNYKTSKKTFF